MALLVTSYLTVLHLCNDAVNVIFICHFRPLLSGTVHWYPQISVQGNLTLDNSQLILDLMTTRLIVLSRGMTYVATTGQLTTVNRTAVLAEILLLNSVQFKMYILQLQSLVHTIN